MKFRIDMGDPATRVALAVCDCGWRGLACSKLAALERLAAHERVWHPLDSNVQAALYARTARAKTE